MDQPDIQKHLNAQVARLVMELATALAVIEHQETKIAALTERDKHVRETGDSGSVDGARSADGPRRGVSHG